MARYTTDADLPIDPSLLGRQPLVEELLADAGFARPHADVGAWIKALPVEGVPRSMVVDCLVPDTLGGPAVVERVFRPTGGCTHPPPEDLQDGQSFGTVRIISPFTHRPEAIQTGGNEASCDETSFDGTSCGLSSTPR